MINRMKLKSFGILTVKALIAVFLISCSGPGTKSISIIETTDIHGVILPYDYIEKEKLNSSLASSYTYIKSIRAEKDATILLDNGDNIQGQPDVYYYNFIDTASKHLLADVMNYMRYDVGTVGNHDIETGHAVYDRLVNEYDFPLLAANAINIESGLPYFKPYYTLKKKGIKVVVFGLVTPLIPNWLPNELYEGIEFKGMLETAREWMPAILKEKPDLVVGLFHSGWNSSIDELHKNDDGSVAVAYNVPGFDIIFTGHDHKIANENFVNMIGDTVLILNGGSKSRNLAQADITFTNDKKKGKKHRIITGKIVDVEDFEPNSEFLTKFIPQHDQIIEYVNRVIGISPANISSRDSYFGPSAFVDMIHSIQLEITGADISFAAPLSFDVQIPKGPITVGDMFKLYRFENMLYTMKLSGEEIQKYLEYSYSKWYNVMRSPEDEMLKLRLGKDGKPILTKGKVWLQNQPYNFDSAVGIDYTVNISKPNGARINISRLSNGATFDKNKIYTVAANSYRGNGGGGHFTKGVGLTKDELRSRLLASTERDLRYYILKSIESSKTINSEPINNWKIIPAMWVKSAIPREYKLLFGIEK
jgi:2',3'-cyclic-nucleotide 2'-phosphodiesterase / 3'-nucleotidase